MTITMGLFRSRKKFPSIDEIELLDKWGVSRGDYQGKPLVARFRTSAKSIVGHPSYPYQVGIAVPLIHPDQKGFPKADETKQLDSIEEAIDATLQDANESLFIGVISTNGMREFILYTSSPSDVKDKFVGLQEVVSSHELQLMIREDPEWGVYKSFVR